MPMRSATHTKRSVDNTSVIFEHTVGALKSLDQGTDDTSSFHPDGFGLYKVYAIVDDRFIIYDGRVGSALGLLAREFLPTVDHVGLHDTLVPLLAFPFKKERSSTQKYIRPEESSRNPSNGDYMFTEVEDHADHAKWMLRTSWIVEEMLVRLSQPAVTNRHIEAALFMMGYPSP